MTRWRDEHKFDAEVQRAAQQFGVPVPLIKAVIAHESGFNPLAVRKEAPRDTLPPTPDFPQGGDESRGLMQVLVRTARTLGLEGDKNKLYDPTTNIGYGVALLAENLKRAQGHLDVALSAYNGGWSSARSNDAKRVGGPGSPFVNQDYVNRVSSYYDYFRQQDADGTGANRIPIVFGGSLTPWLILFGVGVAAYLLWQQSQQR